MKSIYRKIARKKDIPGDKKLSVVTYLHPQTHRVHKKVLPHDKAVEFVRTHRENWQFGAKHIRRSERVS